MASPSIAIVAGGTFVLFIACFFFVPRKWWPRASDKLTADRYYNPRTHRWTTEIPEGTDPSTVHMVRGGQSLIRGGLQQLEAEGFTRGERTLAIGWGLLGATLPALGIALLVAGESTRIPGLVCLVAGLLISVVPAGHIVRSRVRRRERIADARPGRGP
jgi:hypothetical protein